MEPEVRKEIESIVGRVRGDKLTGKQHYDWAMKMMEDADNEFRDVLNGMKVNTDHYLSVGLIDRHWLGQLGPDIADETLGNAAAIMARMAHTMRVFLSVDETAKFMEFVKTNRISGFAGAEVPDHQLPATNCLFEISFAAGDYPVLMPKGDGVPADQGYVRIKKVAIHCVHDQMIEPTTVCADPAKAADFLKWGQIVAFIEDALGEIYTFSGVVQYGQGGATMFPIWNADELAIGYSGQHPRGVQGEPMSNLSQFVCGILAHLISYHQKEGSIHYDMEAMTVPEISLTNTEEDV